MPDSSQTDVDLVVEAACERLGSSSAHQVRVAIETCREMEVAPLARRLHSLEPDRERVRRRVAAALEGETYSVVEMAADLERLATHPVWHQADHAAGEVDALASELARLREAPKLVWLGGYIGCQWSLAFSTVEAAREWLAGDSSGARQITSEPIEVR